MSIAVREITVADSQALASLLTQLARETKNSLLTESEALIAGESQQERITDVLRSPNQKILVAVSQTSLVGLLGLTQGHFERNRHCCSLMIGILQSHWGQGVAGQLFDQGLTWAANRGIHRIEVGVRENNQRAIALYERYGFNKEGVRKNALCFGRDYENEIIMARLS